MLLYREPGLCNNEVAAATIERYERDAAKHWDGFYHRNVDKFYKDRHYFDREFPELMHGEHVLLEVGCGAGNTVYPVLEMNPQLHIYACDFSPRAVEIVKAHPKHASGQVKAFVADITRNEDLAANVPPGTVDFITMVFVLSAISPAQMHAAIANLARLLKPGTGRLLFRDYARGDMAQDKHQSSGVKKLGENFYLRGDGTRCYYFEQRELADMFEGHGFSCTNMFVHERDVENHKKGITMHRRWVQGVFKLDGVKSIASRYADVDMGEESAPVAGSWLVGAAGRLVAGVGGTPGVPSGRAQLPLSLDSADEMARALSPSCKPMADAELEELEREFFETIARDTQEVVSEELAIRGISAIQLADPLPALTPQRPGPGQSAPSRGTTRPSPLSAASSSNEEQQQQQQQQPQQPPQEVSIRPGLSFLCHMDPGVDMSMELALASLCAACPQLLANRAVVQMQAGPSGMASMAAVRSARRVMATNAERGPLESLSLNLRLNSSRLVVERLRACHLAWGDPGHMQQALRQAPDPPGCYDVLLAAGLMERCLSQEDTGGDVLVRPPAAGSSSSAAACMSGHVHGGSWFALVAARQLVQMHQCSASLPSVSRGASPCVTAPAGRAGAAPGAIALLVERRGVLLYLQQQLGLQQTLLGLGWELVAEQLPPELAAWMEGPVVCGMGPGVVAEHLDLLVLRPV